MAVFEECCACGNGRLLEWRNYWLTASGWRLAPVIEEKSEDPKPWWPHQSAFSGRMVYNQWCVQPNTMYDHAFTCNCFCLHVSVLRRAGPWLRIEMGLPPRCYDEHLGASHNAESVLRAQVIAVFKVAHPWPDLNPDWSITLRIKNISCLGLRLNRYTFKVYWIQSS